MKKFIIIFVGMILFLAALLFAVPGLRISITQGFKDGYDKSFKKSFTESFIQACSKNNPQMVCGCIVNQATAQLTVSQLQDQRFALDYMQKNITPGCVDAYKRNNASSRTVKGG